MSHLNSYNKNRDNSLYTRLVGKNMSVSPFSEGTVSDRVYKKTERLALATYLLSNHIPQKDILKKTIREKVNNLIDLVSEGVTTLHSESVVTPVLIEIRKILTILNLMYVSSLISELNLNVIKKSYIDFADFLMDSAGSEGAENVDISQFFYEDEVAEIGKSSNSGNFDKNYDNTPLQQCVKRPEKGGKTTNVAKRKRQKNISVKSRAIKSNRRVVILDMVAKKGRITVKDVASQIPDASPKTLQRELMNLVSEGSLVKMGDKRWTIYALPNK